MALVVKDRVRETSTSTGTGTITLNGAVAAFQSFAVIGNGNTTYYTIVDAVTGAWEVGIGTYTSSGTLLSRDTILESSNAGSAVDFAAGVKDVFCTYPAERSIYTDAAGSAITPATASALPAVSGGTGLTSPGTSGNVLTSNGTTWASSALPDVGDVDGPASATDNAVARYDGTTGKIIQNSAVTIADDGATVIAANSTSDGLRITQLGTGNALVVEDSANPDASPFVVTNDGSVVQGSTVRQFATSLLETNADGGANFGIGINNWNSSGSFGPSLNFLKSQGGTVGTNGLVSNGAFSGLVFRFNDGATFLQAATITAVVDGTPGTNDMPGRLQFSTTADGASSPTERMRIDNQGQVGIGGTPTTGVTLRVTKNITGATAAYGVYASGAVQSDVTSQANYFLSLPSTAAASFTLTNLRHYNTFQSAFGAGSAVTNQIGFEAGSSLTGATNNYGFFGNIASGTGRWNFYAAGTAENFFAGATTISTNSTTNALRITQTGTGNALLVEDSANPDATPFVIRSDGQVIVGATAGLTSEALQLFGGTDAFRFVDSASAQSFRFFKGRGTANAFTTIVANNDSLGNIDFYGADGTNPILGARITASVDGTPGTNDMPGRLLFSTTADGASSPTERMRIGSNGRIGIARGTTDSAQLIVGGTNDFGAFSETVLAIQTFGAGVSSRADSFISFPSVNNSSGTLSQFNHFYAAQNTFTTTVTNQAGFRVESNLTGATNNYGFYSNIASGVGRWNFYAAGTALNYFAGITLINTTATSPTTESARLQIENSGAGGITISRSLNDGSGSWFMFYKTRGTSGSATIVQNDDVIGQISWQGADGAKGVRAAGIVARVDGVPGTDDMPGRLEFQTTADGASTPTERIRIKSAGQMRFVPLAADPAGAEAGDVYYNSGDNKLKVYNGTSWIDLH
jgi:hypothetical protein